MTERVLVMSQTTYDHIIKNATEDHRRYLENQKANGELIIRNEVEDFRFFNMRKSDVVESR